MRPEPLRAEHRELIEPSPLGPYRVADLLRRSETRIELIWGHYVTPPTPVDTHQDIAFAIARRFDDIAATTGGRMFIAPMDVHLADHSVAQPDVVYVGPDRVEVIDRWVRGVPSLVVEVLSPSTRRYDQETKRRLYAETGVPEYWLVDVDAREVTFLVLDDGRYAEAPSEGERYASPVNSGVTLDLAALWRRLERE